MYKTIAPGTRQPMTLLKIIIQQMIIAIIMPTRNRRPSQVLIKQSLLERVRGLLLLLGALNET